MKKFITVVCLAIMALTFASCRGRDKCPGVGQTEQIKVQAVA